MVYCWVQKMALPASSFSISFAKSSINKGRVMARPIREMSRSKNSIVVIKI